MVNGLRVVDALAQLEFSPKLAAVDVAKAIKSAAANAEHNHQLARDQLWLKQVLVDEGPTMRRHRQVSRGMAHEYFHRTCHITAIVEDRPEPEPAPRAAPRRRTTEARPPRPPRAARPAKAAESEVPAESFEAPAEAVEQGGAGEGPGSSRPPAGGIPPKGDT